MVRADARLRKEFRLITLPVLILHGLSIRTQSQVEASIFTIWPVPLTKR
jgi:hypothetical protein